MPQLGESIAEATIMQLLVQPGDTVQADQEVFEVETTFSRAFFSRSASLYLLKAS